MKSKTKQGRPKTFPLEMGEELHKALKHRAIESDKTLHSYIIETLAEKIQEDRTRYARSGEKPPISSETKR